jgi:putative ABC transport system permease protein
MRKLTLRSLWEHKRRLISTVLAIVLGVAFMVGTFVFSDTLSKVFDDLFATANENVDARVQGEVVVGGQGGGDLRGRFDESVLDDVEAVDGVAVALPSVTAFGGGPTNRILDANGDPVGASNGPPTLIENWTDDETLSPYQLTEGRGPEADDEIALNVAAARDGNFSIGDQVTLTSQFGPAQYTLVGIFRFGDSDSAAGAVSADFTLREAQRLAGAEGQLDAIHVGAEDGVSQQDVTQRITDALDADGVTGVEVITGEQAAEQDADSVQEGLQFFTLILSIFGFIALGVSIFLIYNTFQILLAQRTRELALLRAVGASRVQVLRSVLVEAVVIGVVAAALGVITGILLAAGILAALDAAGVDVPSSGVVIRPNRVMAGLLLGLVVTVIAAVFPAIKATRVPPLAAIRDVAIDRGGSSKIRWIIAGVVLVVAVLLMSNAWSADGDSDAIPTVGLGTVLLIVGAILVGPLMAGGSIRTIGRFLPRFKGVTGRLATENAARSPRRTSATAAALLIGVALIGFVTVFAESAKASVEAEVNRGLDADLIVQPEGGGFNFFGFSPTVAETVASVDGVDQVARFGAAQARITYPDGGTADTFVGAVDPPAFAEMATPKMEEGELTDLQPGGVIVDRQIAEDSDLELGDPILVTFSGGGQLETTVEAISDDLVILAQWTITTQDYDDTIDQPLDFQVMATVDEGADVEEVQGRVETALEGTPGIAVLNQQEFIGDIASQLTAFVNVIYGLLALSIIIAMIGVANTLSLSIHERTRELGLLRAVGMARNQVRSAIRWEAVLIAVLGTLIGLALGLVGSYVMIKALEGFGLTTFEIPYGTLVFQVIVAAGLAVLASWLSGRRAAKLDILKAIAQE